ncbi:MAG: class I SAM-dependent methyltransferase [Patescibacteria group bacterium]|nr:class I SAM-dependent methyltransferase [Patescibacteria group bacterium]
MKEKIKSILKSYPSIYHFVQNYYWKTLSLKAKFLRTKMVERKWQNRKDLITAKDFWLATNHLHRQLLIKKIESFSPISSVLEIGCGFGSNLYLLAKKFPKAKIKGIDINPKFIQVSKEIFSKEKILNVETLIGRADELGRFSAKSFDVVFTDAVLMYIGPDKIKKVIKEITRIAKKALIFVEWQSEKEEYDAHVGVWKRNYLNLLSNFFSKERISLSKIPKEAWPDENWQKFGYLIEVKL